MPPVPSLVLWLWGGGGAAVLVGILCLWAAGRADRKNYIIEKAPPLSLKLVNERDDAWVAGVVACLQPLTTPHFGDRCVHFDYELEERVTRTVTRNGKTTTETSWRTLEHTRRATPFSIAEGTLEIMVNCDQAEYKNLPVRSETIGRLRHSVRYLAVAARVSAVGSISEGKRCLERFANIPLIVTTRTRAAYLEALETGEAIYRIVGFCFGFLGLTAACYGLSVWRGWPEPFRGTVQWRSLGVAAGLALVAVTPVWMLLVYNTCVEYRARIENAWRHIDVDLQMRFDLIPRLVDAARGYMQHEQALFEALATLRSEAAKGKAQAIATENRLAETLGRFLAVAEKNPELKAQELTAHLIRELTAIEEKIAFARSFFNDTVTEYNSYVMTFPRRLVTWLAGFGPETGFTAVTLSSVEKLPPAVSKE